MMNNQLLKLENNQMRNFIIEREMSIFISCIIIILMLLIGVNILNKKNENRLNLSVYPSYQLKRVIF